MREIKLDLNALEVESFATLAPAAGRGTVVGNAKTNPDDTECCATYAPYVCPSANDGCPTAAHGVTICFCQTQDVIVCPIEG